MVIRFTVDVHSLATGKDYKAGQEVPHDFPNIEGLIRNGSAAYEGAETNKSFVVPREMIEEYGSRIVSKAPTSDSKAINTEMLYLIKDMTYNELTELLRENELKVSGSKEDKLQRLIDFYEGGGE